MKTAARRTLILLPLAGCALIYLNIHHLIVWAGLPEIQGRLLAGDLVIFGGHPSVWWAHHGRGWVTDILSFCYLGYNLVVGAVVLTAVLRRPSSDAWIMVRGLTATYLMGYVLYVLLPAEPPHIVLAESLNPGISGGWLSTIQVQSTTTNPNAAHGAFPSLHCAVTLVAMCAAWGLNRKLFLVLLLPALGLLPAVFFLGHHYAADVIAGLFLGAVVHMINGRLSTRGRFVDGEVTDGQAQPHSRSAVQETGRTRSRRGSQAPG